MKKVIAATIFTLSMCGMVHSTSAQTSAENINSLDVRGLTPEQKAELVAKTVELQKQAKTAGSSSEVVRKEAEQWISLGGNMGRAAVAAAKELGVAANDFVGTPLGKVTMAVVVYKIMGKEIIHLGLGGVLLFLTISMSWYLFRKKCYQKVEYEREPVLWGLYQRKIVTSYEENYGTRNYYTTVAWWTLFIGTVISLVTILTA